jgi:hypothetical protein
MVPELHTRANTQLLVMPALFLFVQTGLSTYACQNQHHHRHQFSNRPHHYPQHYHRNFHLVGSAALCSDHVAIPAAMAGVRFCGQAKSLAPTWLFVELESTKIIAQNGVPTVNSSWNISIIGPVQAQLEHKQKRNDALVSLAGCDWILKR